MQKETLVASVASVGRMSDCARYSGVLSLLQEYEAVNAEPSLVWNYAVCVLDTSVS